jgi:hypothetical protein
MIGNRDPSASVYLGYDVKQFDIQQAIERNLRNSSKKLLNMNESRKMINVRQWEQTPNGQAANPLARSYKEQINDPSSHFERNVKRYTYDGAAMSQGQNLDILRASKNLSHIKREQAMDWDLQKPRDSALYHISVTQNLKQLDQQLVAEMGAARQQALLDKRNQKNLQAQLTSNKGRLTSTFHAKSAQSRRKSEAPSRPKSKLAAR